MKKSPWIALAVALGGCAQMTDVSEPRSQANVMAEQEAACDARCRQVLSAGLKWVSENFKVEKGKLFVNSNVELGPGPKDLLDARTVAAFASVEGVSLRNRKDIEQCDENRLQRRWIVHEGKRGLRSRCYLTEGIGLVTFQKPRLAEDGSIRLGVIYFGLSTPEWPHDFMYVQHFLTVKQQGESWVVVSAKIGVQS